MTKLTARTLTSKKALKEIVALFPQAKKIKRQHVAGVGYVLYIKNSEGKNIAHAVREFGGVVVREAA